MRSRRLHVLIILLGLLLLGLFTSTIAQNKKSNLRMLYNTDGTDIMGNYYYNCRPSSIADVQSYIDRIANTPVTTVLVCTGALSPYHRSKYDRAFGDGEDVRLINRLKVRPEDSAQNAMMKIYRTNFKILSDQGTDIVKVAVDRAKEKGKEAFITIRMNDLHFTDTIEYFPSVKSEFWLDHPEYWMGDHPGWHAVGGYNFAHKAVRDHKLNRLKEECEMYNIDGVELDFMRFFEIFPFEHGREYLDIMTGWMKEIRESVNQIAKQKKTKIMLTVRIPPRLELCMDKGLDVKKWLELNLIDFISVGPHWICDPNLPVAKFKNELGNPKIPFYVTVDDGQFQPREFRSNGIYRGAAANYYAQGADGLYLFNFFFSEKEQQQLAEIKKGNDAFMVTIKEPTMLNELGSVKMLENRNKIYTLSDGSQETSYLHETPFPIFMSAWEEYKVKMNIPENFSTGKPEMVTLFLRGTKDSKFQVKLNGVFIDPANSDLADTFKRKANLLPEDAVYVFNVPFKLLKNGYNDFNFRSIQPKPFFMKRIEVAVNYGNVKVFGYF